MAGIRQLGGRTAPKHTYVQDQWLLDEFSLGLMKSQSPQRVGVFYPSALGNKCDKFLYLSYFGGLPEEVIDARVRRIFDCGDYLGYRYEKYFEHLGMLVGTEVPVKLSSPNISGRMDFLIRHPDSHVAVVELKSINSKGFAALGGSPKSEHLVQLQLYLNIANYTMGIVLYENKDTQDIKAFKVIKDEEAMKSILDRCHRIMNMEKMPARCTGGAFCGCRRLENELE